MNPVDNLNNKIKSITSSKLDDREKIVEIFKAMLSAFDGEKNAYCSGFMGIGKKSAEQFGDHLNKEMNKHHFPRMLGSTLKLLYDKHQFPLDPDMVKLVQNIKSSYEFNMFIPQDNKNPRHGF